MDLYDWAHRTSEVNIDILTPRELLLIVSEYLEWKDNNDKRN